MHYKFYSMDRQGHIAFAHDEDCRDDDEARARAETSPGSHGVEVWQGSRLVACVKPRRTAA